MPLTERGEVVAGYEFGEFATGLMKTVSPRESQEKSDAACATRRTAATTDSSFAPRGTAPIATCSFNPEDPAGDLVIFFSAITSDFLFYRRLVHDVKSGVSLYPLQGHGKGSTGLYVHLSNDTLAD